MEIATFLDERKVAIAVGRNMKFMYTNHSEFMKACGLSLRNYIIGKDANSGQDVNIVNASSSNKFRVYLKNLSTNLALVF